MDNIKTTGRQLYVAYMQGRSSSRRQGYEFIPAAGRAAGLADLKKKIEDMKDVEFILTMEIGDMRDADRR